MSICSIEKVLTQLHLNNVFFIDNFTNQTGSVGTRLQLCIVFEVFGDNIVIIYTYLLFNVKRVTLGCRFTHDVLGTQV